MWIIELISYLGETVLLEKVSPVYFVYQYQSGVLLRRGKYVKTIQPGWNYKFPIIDRFLTCTIVNETVFISNVNITTKDGKPCTISASMEITIEDAKKYLLNANDAASNVKDISMGVIADNLIDCVWEDINRRKTINEIKRSLNKELEDYGINVKRFWFTDLTITRVFTLFQQ